MAEPRWTPAPWRVEGRRVVALKEKWVCECPSGGIIHGKVDAANAALIAAAPDLYEALIKCQRHLAVNAVTQDLVELYEEVRAALARARGET